MCITEPNSSYSSYLDSDRDTWSGMRVARRHLQVTMEESLKKSVAKIEGLLKENARVSSPDFPPRPLRSSVPHAFGRKSITLHHEKLHLPTFEGKAFPHKFEAFGKPPVKDLAAQPTPGEMLS